jgi:predicted phage terminase large subunit-like protein
MPAPLTLPITQVDIDREMVRRGGLVEFVRRSWHVIEAVEYVHDRHIEEVCRHLEAVSRGVIDRLLINIPPGCSKSSIVSVLWPAWHWAMIDGGTKWMHTCFDISVSDRDAEKTQKLIQSDWFQARWGPNRQTAGLTLIGQGKRSIAKRIFWTNSKGLRFSTMMRGKATGWHCHIQVCDDPNKPDEIKLGGDKARKALARTRSLWSGTFASRKADPKRFARVVIMQRLHHEDLAASCIKDGYVHLCLPMEFVPERACKTPIGGDWRTERGELLCPNRYNRAAVEQQKIDMGPRVYAAQCQQNPSPEGGTIYKREWMLQRWTELPPDCIFWQSWDCAFKGDTDSDWVVGQVWARSGNRLYLVDQVRRQMSFTETCQAIRDMTAKWPMCWEKLIEAKANGIAVIDQLKSEILGMIPVDPRDGKIARANASTSPWANGLVYLPANAPWLEEFIQEHEHFPMGSADDQVDAASQSITHAIEGGAFLAALQQANEQGNWMAQIFNMGR